MTERCDVLIVGGGPAGSACAWRLRRAGLDVLVLDKQAFPRDKVCAGWITPAVLKALDIDQEDYAARHVFQPITRFRTGVIGGGWVETAYDGPVSYGIRRCEFDHYLLARSGARLRLGEPVTKLERDGGEWVVNGSIRTPMLVGAGGHFCPIARHLGAQLGRNEPAVAAQEIEFPLSPRQEALCQVEPDRPELYFCPDLKGYGWCFRKQNYLNVGLGRQDNRGLAEHVERFVDFLKRHGRIPPDLPARFRGHAYLLYGAAPRNLVDDAVLLIGDAAGLAYPQSGEGIRPAIESGLFAAQTILAAGDDYQRANLEPYPVLLAERFGGHPDRSPRRAAPPLPAKVQQFLAARLLATRWFSRHVLLDRWFLHNHQAPLRV